MVLRALAQYQVSQSWERAAQMLQATSEEVQSRSDQQHALSLYLTWPIPTLGFIGTVVGISNALSFIGGMDPQDLLNPEFLPEAIGLLALAFSTTLVSLVLSALLIAVLTLVQSRGEAVIADIYADCVENLLNKLHEDERDHGTPARS